MGLRTSGQRPLAPCTVGVSVLLGPGGSALGKACDAWALKQRL